MNSTIDDPTLHCALLPAFFFFTEHRHHKNRWVTCAEEMCFRNEFLRSVQIPLFKLKAHLPFLRQFFMTGKTLPVKRGGGVDQPVMIKLAQMIKRGDWVHIFPEGGVNFTFGLICAGRVSHTGVLQGLKWGVGKVICDSVKDGIPPMVVPFYHTGMEQVMPKKGRFPRLNKHIHIFVGNPIDLDHLICKCQGTRNPQITWSEITKEIEKSLKELEAEARGLKDDS